MFTVGVTAPEELYSTPTIRAARSARAFFGALLAVGAVSSVFWRPGVVVLLTGFVGALIAQLVVGLAGYRAAMRRPWPAVKALDDDEDDW